MINQAKREITDDNEVESADGDSTLLWLCDDVILAAALVILLPYPPKTN